ncbi:ATP-binding cassette domain-containing protein [Fundicoccus culcitae]|uniref:ABC transporter ATP-binding protein n=1 Tax=Fundicoccus culcitae TaxID=2969821 RepID=A0ABY5P848_9LACT|nr:ABC transporter ATP-binding protein [Fundicoccus culcitae]UUX34694.1 ABC transporter ATP-binding protein [Fundicoccus culcitae]
METKVAFKQVNLTIKRHQILENINFTLPQVGIVGLLGRNGAGKSTLMALLAGYRLQTSGEVLIDKQVVYENPASMQQVSFSYPRDCSGESEKVMDYVEWNAQYRAFFDMEYAIELLEKFELPDNEVIYNLSKGMQAALNASIGLASNAPITVFDEVYLSMDAPSRDLFYSEVLRSQAKHPRLIIMSTHLISEAEYLFDHILILDKGRLLFDESYGDLIERGCQVSGFTEEVVEFLKDYPILNQKEMGNLTTATVFGVSVEDLRAKNTHSHLDIQPVALQDLFNYLTKKGAHHDSK